MKLLTYFKRTPGLFIGTSILIIINSGIQTLAGISSANALSAIGKLQATEFAKWVIIMGLAYLVYSIFVYFINVGQNKLAQTIDTLLRDDIAAKLAQTNYQSFHKQTTSTYASWLTNDINTINEFGVGDLMMIIQQISEIFMSGITLMYFHYSLIISVLILTVIMAIVPNLFSKWLSSQALKYTKANERLVNSINDILNGFNTLYLANMTRIIINKINHASTDVKYHKVNYSKASQLTQGTASALALISETLLLGQSGWLVLKGLTPLGAISGVNYFSGTIFRELSGISFNWQEFKSTTPIIEKILNIPANPQPQQISILPSEYTIMLNQVSFQYPKQKQPIFNKIDCTFAAGKKYIVTGDSGSGKSTLLKLISGLIPTKTGNIYLGETNYQNLTDKQLHEKISYIQQDPYIFNASLLWNLTLGNKVPKSDLQAAIQVSGLDDLISSLPEGLKSNLATAGNSLSGGQKQRISFARAWLQYRPIYLLDEATSALDKESSRQLEQAILTRPQTTVIIITHHLRPETKQLADKVIPLSSIKI